jgi:hypothetical protein
MEPNKRNIKKMKPNKGITEKWNQMQRDVKKDETNN